MHPIVFRFARRLMVLWLTVTAVLLQSTISSPSLKTLGVGTEAPDFACTDLEGKRRQFADFKGKQLTLILFWATWSRNSEPALKKAQQLYETHKEHGLNVIGINVDKQRMDEQTQAAVRKESVRLAITFPLLQDHGLVTFHEYGVIAVPTTVIVDANRVIRFELSGFPLVGSSEMGHFLVAALEGRDPWGKSVKAAGYVPDSKAVAAVNMGTKALQSRRTSRSAEMWFKKAIAADPKFSEPHLGLGRMYQQQGDLAAAETQFREAVSLDPKNASALGGLGKVLLQAGKGSEAKALLEQAVAEDKAYTPGYYLLAYLNGKSGNSGMAEELFAQAEEINPMEYRVKLYRGRLYEEEQDLARAAEQYKIALALLLGLQ